MAQTLEYFQRLGRPVFSVATSIGGPVCVIRISGPDIKDVCKIVSGGLPAPGHFSLKKILNLEGQLLDRALVLNFESPKSFTGENVVELQCHGSVGVVELVSKELKRIGFSPALPGEFSFRAVINGQMSLEDAEKLNFTLTSESIDQSLSEKLLDPSSPEKSFQNVNLAWDELLLCVQMARGRVEAAIDFPEAEEEQGSELNSARELLSTLESRFVFFLNVFDALSRGSQEDRFLILGPPNAGKSTLLNILSGVQSALVSERPGTTRDLVEVRLQGKNNKWFRFIDSAGLRADSTDVLEEQGMSLALEALSRVRGVIWVEPSGVLSDKQLLFSDVCFDGKVFQQKALSILNSLGGKMNLGFDLQTMPNLAIFSHWDQDPRCCLVSGQEPQGVFDFEKQNAQVREFVLSWINQINSSEKPVVDFFVSRRQAELLSIGKTLLLSAQDSIRGARPLELAGEDLRECEEIILKARGKDLGEEYIGQIFSQFCLGK